MAAQRPAPAAAMQQQMLAVLQTQPEVPGQPQRPLQPGRVARLVLGSARRSSQGRQSAKQTAAGWTSAGTPSTTSATSERGQFGNAVQHALLLKLPLVPYIAVAGRAAKPACTLVCVVAAILNSSAACLFHHHPGSALSTSRLMFFCGRASSCASASAAATHTRSTVRCYSSGGRSGLGCRWPGIGRGNNRGRSKAVQGWRRGAALVL